MARKYKPGKRKIDNPLYSKPEVSDLIGVSTGLITYWERIFFKIPIPFKKHKKYRPRDIFVFNIIKDLLYVEKYTPAGAVRQMEHGKLKRTCPKCGITRCHGCIERNYKYCSNCGEKFEPRYY